MDEILPCPFCASVAKVIKGNYGGCCYFVECANDNCQAAHAQGTVAIAIAVWNRRAPTTPVPTDLTPYVPQ